MKANIHERVAVGERRSRSSVPHAAITHRKYETTKIQNHGSVIPAAY
jgi:hypothetical protein